MFGEFTKNFQARLSQPDDAAAAPADAAAKPISATSLAWQTAKGVFRRDS